MVIARALITPSLQKRSGEINAILTSHIPGGSTNHPDVLYFTADSKLGIAEARNIKNHFSLKPYSAKGRIVVLEDASVMTIEAQNALLKTLEELPKDALFILGASSDANLLPTVLSRCKVINLAGVKYNNNNDYNNYIETMLGASTEERFDFIANLKEKEEFLSALVAYFRDWLIQNQGQNLNERIKFVQELLQAEEWAKRNVNIRAILEYLMLKMPKKTEV